MIHWQGNWKILFASGFSWLEAWINFVFRNTLGFLSTWRLVANLDKLEKPVLLLALSHLTAFAKVHGQQSCLRFWRLR